MTVIPVAYRLTVEGASDVAGTIAKTGKGLDDLGGAFKKVAGDIDVMGKSQQEFARLADNVFGLAAAFTGGGGLVLAAAGAATVIGSTFMPQLERMWDWTKKNIDSAHSIGRAVIDLKTDYENLNNAIKIVIDRKKDKNAAEREEILITRQAILAHSEANQALTRLAFAIVQQDLRNSKTFIGQTRAVQQLEELNKKLVENEIETNTARLGVVIAAEEHRKQVQYEAVEAILKIDEEESKRRQDKAKELRDNLIALEMDRINEQNAVTKRAREDADRDTAKAILDAAKEEADLLKEVTNAINKDAEKQASDRRKYLEDMHEAEQLIKRNTAALKAKEEAERSAAAGALAHAQAQNVVAAAQMVAQPIVSELTSSLRELGNVNRDNMDLYRIEASELPAIIAAKVQGIMAGIAAEAAGRHIMEAGNAASEIAFGIAAIATPGLQATAPGHFAAAAQHGSASAIYATLAGVSAGGAGLIAYSRGSGGLFQLTKEEADERNRRLGRGDYQRHPDDKGAGGSSTSRVGGQRYAGGGEAQPTVINITYAAGAVGGDERRTAQTVARGMAAARRNGFTRRMAEG